MVPHLVVEMGVPSQQNVVPAPRLEQLFSNYRRAAFADVSSLLGKGRSGMWVSATNLFSFWTSLEQFILKCIALEMNDGFSHNPVCLRALFLTAFLLCDYTFTKPGKIILGQDVAYKVVVTEAHLIELFMI